MRLKIICVDDDLSLLQMLKTSLGAVLNADVTTYPGAKDAVDKLAAESPPNILIVDYMMPSMDGLTFLGTVANLAGWDKTCFLMLSAVGSNIKQAAFRQRVYAMIDKPIKPVLLAQTVSDMYQKFCSGEPSPLAAQIKAKADEEAAKRLRPKR
jgi:CheY-like chemotaxis protein